MWLLIYFFYLEEPAFADKINIFTNNIKQIITKKEKKLNFSSSLVWGQIQHVLRFLAAYWQVVKLGR